MNSSHDQSCETIDWCIGDAPLDGTALVAAIGNFDGVHRGHAKVISAAIDAARAQGLASAVVTLTRIRASSSVMMTYRSILPTDLKRTG